MMKNILQAVPLLIVLAVSTFAEARPTITVAPPQLVFKPVSPVIWETEPSITADEIALSQELGSLVRQQQYQQTLDLLENHDTPLSAPFELLRAQLYATLNNYSAAIRAYEKAIELAPNFTRAHAGLGTLQLIQGNHQAAHRHLAEAVRLGAGDAQSFAQLGYLNVKLGNPWAAVSAYERALMLEPDNEQWRYALMLALTESGNYGTARSLLESLLAKNPGDPMLWQQRADLALREENLSSAMASLEMSLRLGDNSTDNRRAAAQLAVQLGNAHRGAELATAAVVSGSNDMEFVGQLADWMVRNRQERHASTILAAMANRLNSYSAVQRGHYYYLKGRIAEQSGNLAQALADYRRAVEQDGSNGLALVAYAETALTQNALTRAMLTFQRLEALPAYRQQGLVGQAKTMIAQNDYVGALRKLQDTLDEFPDAFELNAPIQSLTAIVNTMQSSNVP
ncbi:MAG: tetratricopeptide repeat protein [Pseudomonadota bacterium]